MSLQTLFNEAAIIGNIRIKVPEDDETNHFGKDGIMRTLSECTSLSLEETLERLFSTSNDFTKGSGRQDDTSIVLLEHRIDTRS